MGSKWLPAAVAHPVTPLFPVAWRAGNDWGQPFAKTSHAESSLIFNHTLSFLIAHGLLSGFCLFISLSLSPRHLSIFLLSILPTNCLWLFWWEFSINNIRYFLIMLLIILLQNQLLKSSKVGNPTRSCFIKTLLLRDKMSQKYHSFVHKCFISHQALF